MTHVRDVISRIDETRDPGQFLEHVEAIVLRLFVVVVFLPGRRDPALFFYCLALGEKGRDVFALAPGLDDK